MKDWDEIRNMLSRTTHGDWHKCDKGTMVFDIKTNFDLVAENLIEEDVDFVVNMHNKMAGILAYVNQLEVELRAIVEKAKVLCQELKSSGEVIESCDWEECLCQKWKVLECLIAEREKETR